MIPDEAVEAARIACAVDPDYVRKVVDRAYSNEHKMIPDRAAEAAAKVLECHRTWATTNPDDVWLVTCFDCGETLGRYDDLVGKIGDQLKYDDALDKAHAKHQAELVIAALNGV